MRSIFFVLTLNSMPIVQADEDNSIQKDMINELDTLKYNLSLKYGPIEWKKQYLGWDLEKTFDLSKGRILNENIRNIKDFKRIFKDSLFSLKDYHVHTQFYSTEFSCFPFQVRGSDGRYFLTDISAGINLNLEEFILLVFDDVPDMEKYVEEIKKINLGDEFIAINGSPINEVIEQLIDKELGGDRSPTGYALAEKMLFFTYGKYGQTAPTGTFTVTLHRQGEDSPYTCELPWFHVPEWVKDPISKGLIPGQVAKDTTKGKVDKSAKSLAKLLARDYSVGIAKDFVTPKFEEMFAAAKAMKKDHQHPLQLDDSDDEDEDEDEDEDNRVKGFLPPLGNVLWETDQENDFYAYIYENADKKRIGYLHIPTFGEGGESAVEVLSQIIDRFNSETDALVLDITNNPGGDLFYTYGVMSLLTDHPLRSLTQREALTQEDVYQAAYIYKVFEEGLVEGTMNGYAFDEVQFKKIMAHQKLILDIWQSGARVTQPLPLFGIDEVLPHPRVQYMKPLLVLINELDFSCADLFPAILQDNGRGVLFGKTTAGAGGYVRGYRQLSRFGIAGYSLTGSLLYRLDGMPIENLGVKPDIPYEITQKDILDNYSGYIKAVNTAVKDITIDP